MVARWLEVYNGDMEKVRRTPAARFFGLAPHLGVMRQVGLLLSGGEEKNESQPVTPGSAIRVGKEKVIRG